MSPTENKELEIYGKVHRNVVHTSALYGFLYLQFILPHYNNNYLVCPKKRINKKMVTTCFTAAKYAEKKLFKSLMLQKVP